MGPAVEAAFEADLTLGLSGSLAESVGVSYSCETLILGRSWFPIYSNVSRLLWETRSDSNES